jgi:hypothetical protein
MIRRIALVLIVAFRWPIDLVMSVLLIPAGFVLKIFRMIGAGRLRLSTSVLRNIGVFPIRDHYYEPLFNPAYLTTELNQDRFLPGISLHENEQLDLLSGMEFSNELLEMNLLRKPIDPGMFYINNGSFNSGDAEFLYQFIRNKKPRRVVEIGSGNSTKIAKCALDKNFREAGDEYTHVCIEPYEMPWLESIGVEVIRERVENCPLHIFSDLEAGDLLFIDSSHVIRPQAPRVSSHTSFIETGSVRTCP